MIPHMHIIAWSNDAPWASLRQIEQDLIIIRSVIDIFNDDFLADELRFRGGTALNKLHFPQALRYSEDIDLVRTSEGPIGPVLDRLREVLGWLGQAQFEQSPVAPKLIYHVDADDSGPQLRLKVEINTREREAYDAPVSILHAVDNPWFTGQADVVTYSREELLATKLRALLQRDQGRDLFDLARALEIFEGLNKHRVVEIFVRYLALQDLNITRAQAEQRMFAKLQNPGFLSDLRPLLPAPQAQSLNEETMKEAFVSVFVHLITGIAGEPWRRTEEMAKRFEVDLSTSAT